MIIEHVYPKSKLILSAEYAKPIPEQGSSVKISGDPDSPVLDGSVIGVDDLPHHRVLFIDVNEDQEGARALADWVQMSGDLGVMLVPPPDGEGEEEQ